MARITNASWNRYKRIINTFSENVNKEVVQWHRAVWAKSEFGEESILPPIIIELEALIGFNTFRNWPITNHRTEGAVDNQNMVLWLNREYLSLNDWLTPEGYFNFDSEKDLFIHRGITYKAEGDTFSDQAKDDPLHLLIILARQEISSGTHQYEQS